MRMNFQQGGRLLIVSCFLLASPGAHAFAPLPVSRTTKRTQLPLVPADLAWTATTSSVIAEETSVESWRQYVPLAVSCLVILDILLGSPAANSVLGVVRSSGESDNDKSDSDDSGTSQVRSALDLMRGKINNDNNLLENTRGERIDSAAVAQAAIDKARNTLELKQFLEEQKSDWDRMEEIRRKMDQQIQEVDEKLEQRKDDTSTS